jgi:hypothetical protein
MSHWQLTGRVMSIIWVGIGFITHKIFRMGINVIIVIILFILIDLNNLGRGLSVAGQLPRQGCCIR